MEICNQKIHEGDCKQLPTHGRETFYDLVHKPRLNDGENQTSLLIKGYKPFFDLVQKPRRNDEEY